LDNYTSLAIKKIYSSRENKYRSMLRASCVKSVLFSLFPYKYRIDVRESFHVSVFRCAYCSRSKAHN